MRIFIICLLISILPFSAFAETRLQVTFVVPDKEGPLFWTFVKDIALVAANDLEIDVEVIYTDNDRFATLASIKKLLSREHKPDYVIVRPFTGNEQSVLQLLGQANIPFVTLESEYDGKDLSALTLDNWLSQIIYDNVEGGRILTEALIQSARQKYPTETLEILALGGDFDSIALQRQQYLSQLYLKKQHDVIVNQIIPTYWNINTVKTKLDKLLERYPNTNIIWSASDQMAVAALQSEHLKNKAYVIGGFDWLHQALELIESGQMHASVGGHFLMAVHGLIDIYEHHHGLNDKPLRIKRKQLELINASNVSEYLAFFEHKQWQKVSFKRFTSSKQNNDIELSVMNIIREFNRENDR